MTEKEKEAEAPLLSSSGNSIDQHHCIITVQLYVPESYKSIAADLVSECVSLALHLPVS